MVGKAVAVFSILLGILLANAALGDAVTAKVSVVLVDVVDGQIPARVYRRITARIGTSTNKIVLFEKSVKQYVTVSPGNMIPLSNPVVPAVPLDSFVTIGADLWNYIEFSGDDQIANGNAMFPAQSSGTTQQNIEGAYGEIQVAVTWQ